MGAALALFVLVGFCWIPVLVLQVKARDMALAAVATGTALPLAYHRIMRWWFWLGWSASLRWDEAGGHVLTENLGRVLRWFASAGSAHRHRSGRLKRNRRVRGRVRISGESPLRVRVAALLLLRVVPALQAQVLLQDLFNDNTLDPALWTAATTSRPGNRRGGACRQDGFFPA